MALNKKKIWLIISCAFLLTVFLAVALITLITWNDSGPRLPNRPHPDTRSELAKRLNGQKIEVFYGYMSPNPFIGGKIWVAISKFPRNDHSLESFLIDPETGDFEWACDKETRWGTLVFSPSKGTELYEVSDPTFSERQKKIGLRKRIGKLGLDLGMWFLAKEAQRGPNKPTTLSFWLKTSSSAGPELIATAKEPYPSTQKNPSTEGRWCRIHTLSNDHLMFDTLKRGVTVLPASMHQDAHWSSDNDMFFLSSSKDIMWFNGRTGEVRNLVLKEKISDILKQSNPAFGTAIDFDYGFVTGTGGDPNHPGVFLHVRRPYSALFALSTEGEPVRLVSAKYPKHSGQWLHSDGSKIVYDNEKEPGEVGSNGNGVFIEELQTGQITTLIEPASENSNCLFAPIFYKDRILYLGDNALMSMRLNGTDKRQIFP